MEKDSPSNYDPNLHPNPNSSSLERYNLPPNFHQFSLPPNYLQLLAGPQQFLNHSQFSNSSHILNPSVVHQNTNQQHFSIAQQFNAQNGGGQIPHSIPSLEVTTQGLDIVNLSIQPEVENEDESSKPKRQAYTIEESTRMHQEKHGFPGMLGSLDCMHWAWENCPVAWKGQFTRGDQGCPTIILEAVASQDLWIWHAFFGVAGSNNDINVLNQSPLFKDTLQGNAPTINFTANSVQYNTGYYLVNGIYPEWPTFVKTIPCPTNAKRELFKVMQEAARKDVERAFGVLQKRWAIVRGPCRLWFREHIKDIIITCVILHNMIVEDEKEDVTNFSGDDDDAGPSSTTTPTRGATLSFKVYMERSKNLRDKSKHGKLQHDLIEHIWQHFGTGGTGEE